MSVSGSASADSSGATSPAGRSRCRILKSGLTALALTFAFCCPDAALADAQQCMTHYYREKSPSCVDEVMTQLKQLPPGAQSDPMTIIGFLAKLFKDTPQERDRILKAEASNYVRSVELLCLHIAGQPDEAQKFAAENYLSAVSEKMRATATTLDALKPSSIPGENDELIGAYMASGDTALVRRILDNYSTADDAMAADAFRIGFMMSKFGTGLTPKGRDPIMMQAACTKYQCKADQTKFLRVLTLATAIWSLQSLAGQGDDGVKKTLSDFLANDSRLKTLLATEQAAFGNYLAAIVVAVGLKDNHSGADVERAYTAMSQSASIYENLGSAKDAMAPVTSLTK